ncbi:multidrug ABC transporter ATPase [Halosimplex litoreum]|uniref:Multidrug ABC transporter ATPase n=1 Tax=Halosimplex litoreum TaxID=1198301 RepID=A0A7U3WBK3_9EURY|nr:multidrug ABC transporter ATPase [Halosimplex litoreum]
MLLVGLFVFDWNPRLLLLLYWFEAGVVVLREALQGLFAELPPSDEYRPLRAPVPLASLADVRGGFRPTRWLPPVYPRNVPYVLTGLIPWAAFWPLGGLVLSGLVVSWLDPVVAPASTAVAALAILLKQSFETADWLRTGEYEAVAATGGVSRTYLSLLFVLAFVAPFVVGLATATGFPRIALGLVLVASKVAYDALELRNPGFVHSTVFDAETVGEDSPVDAPDGEPIAEFRTDRRAVVVVAALFGVLVSVFSVTLFLVLLGGLAGMLVGGAVWGPPRGPAVGALAGVAVVVALRSAVQVVAGWVMGAYTVYRVYPDAVVEYNELTDEPQWAVARGNISEFTVADGRLRSLLPEWFGIARLKSYSGDDRLVGHVSDPEAIAEAIDATRGRRPGSAS